MLGDYQRYEVTVKFAFESEVFPDDPDDVFQLAALEKKTVEDTLRSAFDDVTVDHITVEPIITILA
jgi:hypothetical protein